MRAKILDIVQSAVRDLNVELGYPELAQPTENTALHGGESGLDSLSLVTLIVDIEGQVASSLGKTVVLADEKAMSQRNSPYRTVGALVAFILERISSGIA